MKKLFLLATTMLVAVLSVNAQRRMQVWEGNTYMQFFTTDVDSVTFLSFPEGVLQECEEIHDTIIKTVTVRDTVTLTVRDTITQTIKDTVYVKDTVYINKCGSEGQGTFYVSADRQVSFAKGNLQYQASTKTWRFAENQYDYIGSDNSNISDTYTGWIDLFDWGTGNNPTNASTDYNDYQTFVDWGTNTIGTDAPNIWRTLSKEEWYYIFFIRTNAQKLFGLGNVNGINGTIILPNDWTTPTDVTFIPSTEKGLTDQGNKEYYNSNGDNYTHNTYTLSDWKKMEAAGAVFLPGAGYRYGQSVYDGGGDCRYWSSTANGTSAFHLFFCSSSLGTQYCSTRNMGYPVRLVQDVKIVNN